MAQLSWGLYFSAFYTLVYIYIYVSSATHVIPVPWINNTVSLACGTATGQETASSRSLMSTVKGGSVIAWIGLSSRARAL